MELKPDSALARAYEALPLLCILLFAALYAYAASLYPGGSPADPSHTGFDWIHNYWCNLLNEKAINGLSNPARPVAIGAMMLLCAGLAVFFFRFARVYTRGPFWPHALPISSTLALGLACFLFTPYHDLVTIWASVLGVLALWGVVKSLYHFALPVYKWTAAGNIFLIACNNFIYYTGFGLAHLPWIQKITFAAVLLWIAALNREISRRRGLIAIP